MGMILKAFRVQFKMIPLGLESILNMYMHTKVLY